MPANPFHEAPLETLATALHRAAGSIETHDLNLANPKHAERLRLLLIAAGNRVAPGHASIHTSAEQRAAQGVSYAEAYLAGHARDAAWNRLRWLTRAAHQAMGTKGDQWLRSPSGKVDAQPSSWALASDDGLRRALEALDQVVEERREKPTAPGGAKQRGGINSGRTEAKSQREPASLLRPQPPQQ